MIKVNLMQKTSVNQSPPDAAGRRPYRKPEVKRVRLALEETLATNCKVWGTESPCGPESDGETLWEDGS